MSHMTAGVQLMMKPSEEAVLAKTQEILDSQVSHYIPKHLSSTMDLLVLKFKTTLIRILSFGNEFAGCSKLITLS